MVIDEVIIWVCWSNEVVPVLFCSTSPSEKDSTTLLLFSAAPNDVDHFYVKCDNGGIDVKVVRPLPSPLQGRLCVVGGGQWSCMARSVLVRDGCIQPC